MKRTFLIGISAAIIGGLGLWVGTALGMAFQNTVMGVGGGVILAVVRIGSPLLRLCGFLIGFVLGVFFIAMRLGLLPGGASVVGVAVALAIIMLIMTVISALTSDRIGAWTVLLGALVFVAGFSTVLESAPWTAAQQLPTYFFSLLAMAAIGFLTVVPAELIPEKAAKHKGQDKNDQVAQTAGGPPGEPASESVTPLTDIMDGAK